MATEQDIAEAITYLAIRYAGGTVTIFDSAHENLFYEPDLLATIDSKEVLFLVNGSDSFFASQKKVWRNVEEPFQAKCKGVAEVVISISFISNAAKNELFYVCSKFFDSQYILCDEREDWDVIRRTITDFASTQQRISKQDLTARINAGEISFPELLNGLVTELGIFIQEHLNSVSDEADAFRIDIDRYESIEPFGDVVLQSGSSSDRKSFVALSVISMIRGLSATPVELLSRSATYIRIPSNEIVSIQELESSAIGIQESLGIGYSSLPAGFSIGPIPTNIRSYLRALNSDVVIAIRDRMFSSSPILHDLFNICVDHSLVLSLIQEVIRSSRSKQLLSRKLYDCSCGQATVLK